MGRPPGVKNQDHAAARQQILEAAGQQLVREPQSSMRELARAAGVSPPTLVHYFASRTDVVAALFDDAHRHALVHLHEIAAGALPPVDVSLSFVLHFIHRGLIDSGVADLHALGLSLGPKDAVVGPAYLNDVLEPSLQALEARLERHVGRGELVVTDTRAAALALLAPLVVAVLHQHALGGDRCRPLDIEAFLAVHVSAFVRAWSPHPSSAPASAATATAPATSSTKKATKKATMKATKPRSKPATAKRSR